MKKKIKVLHILNLVGGVEICFRQICENIDTSIIETSIVCQKLVNKSKLVTSKGEEIRDKIDNKIFNLIKKRTQIVRHMLSLKKNKRDIIDYKRIRSILY